MYIVGHPYNILSSDEIHTIVNAAYRILREIGMVINNETLLQQCAGLGWEVNFQTATVRFPTVKVKDFIEQTTKYDWSTHIPSISSTAGVYHGLYLDPETSQLLPWTIDRLATYFALATHLPNIDHATMLGCRMPCPPTLEPLYERYYCWKYGARECGSIYQEDLCPYLYELYQLYAHYKRMPLNEVFSASVFVIPHLKLGYHEAAQVAYFWERGLKVTIGGGMPTMGGSAPATLAGAITLNLAEQLALNLLEWTLYGENHLSLDSSISVLDMRTGIHPFGRPEMVMTNLITAQIARYLHASFSGHSGLTDAKMPSVEAGQQKMMTAIATLLAGGHLWLDAGLLASDEVYSPIQMILDNEMLSALQHLTKPYTIDEQTMGLDVIRAVGPGGHYMDRKHTVENFRYEQWQPSIWSREMLQSWLSEGQKLDTDKAREYYYEIIATSDPLTPCISEEVEQDIFAIINRAVTNLT